MRVYLDDTRKPLPGWTLVKTADEVIALLETNEVELLSLDHDLAEAHYQGTYVGPGVPKTGYDVALWLPRGCRSPMSTSSGRRATGRAGIRGGGSGWGGGVNGMNC
jgi:hypothetical protein